MSRIVTVTERKDWESARRRAAADVVMSEMKAFGTERGGRFFIFGSAAEDRMKFDSDLDVVVDFPAEREAEAVNFVEDVCRKQKLPADIHVKSSSSSRFLDRIQNHMIQLP
jgi:predicted nucleotidyltransferase